MDGNPYDDEQEDVMVWLEGTSIYATPEEERAARAAWTRIAERMGLEFKLPPRAVVCHRCGKELSIDERSAGFEALKAAIGWPYPEAYSAWCEPCALAYRGRRSDGRQER